jgi:glycosyltransferase involved in cell wall biosynthesis
MGVDIFLRALASLSVEHKLGIIGGTGPLGNELQNQARRAGLENVVRFVGHIPEEQLPLYYQAADLFVLPTRAHEGFGLVTVEALACGTPVVATPVGASPEILAHLEASLLSESASAEALAEVMGRALSFATTQDFRERCRDYAERRYNWEFHIDGLEGELISVSKD